MKYAGLKSLADQHGAEKTKKFEQFEYINGHEFDAEVQDGVCRALSAAYLTRNFTRAILNLEPGVFDFDNHQKASEFGPRKFFDAFHSGLQQSEKDVQRWKAISTAQKRDKKPGLITESELIEAAKNTMNSLSRGMLQYVTYTSYGVGSANDLPIPASGESFWLLSTGEHMMAVAVRHKLMGLNAKFFDPNAGQAIFDDVDKLNGFLKEYLIQDKRHVCFFLRFKR